jgi:hypothetical protein
MRNHRPFYFNGRLESRLILLDRVRQSKAKRIMRLVELIRKDNRKISEKVREQVKRGEAIVPKYLS